MKHLKVFLRSNAISLFALLFVTQNARAAEATDAPRTPVFSATFSPFSLILPLVDVSFEGRAARGLGLAALAGYGSVKVDPADVPEARGTGVESIRVSILKLGAQAVYYPLDAFDSLQLGVQGQWIHAFVREETLRRYNTSSATGSGIGGGPFVGYKHIFDFGLTLVAQAGIQAVSISANASDSSGTASKKDTSVLPILNLNAGWSF